MGTFRTVMCAWRKAPSYLSLAGIALGIGVSAACWPVCPLVGTEGSSSTHGVIGPGLGYCSVVHVPRGERPDVKGASLLLAFGRAGKEGGIPLYVSNAATKKWRFLEYVQDTAHPPGSGWSLRWQPNLSVVSHDSGPLKTGTILLAANAVRTASTGKLVGEDLELYASTDGGVAWHYRGSIVTGGPPRNPKDNDGVWEPNIQILPNGLMVAYYSSEQYKSRGYNQLIAQKISRNGGRTWSHAQFDVAIPGGVERPGMPVVARLPNGRYVMSYEDIDGPHSGQVYLKFSRDGLHWGNPAQRGTPVQTQSGEWPAATPIVKWLPVGGPEGVLVVLAQRGRGGGDRDGNSMYWNNDLGSGPWWETPTPVHRLNGNIHSGWTQALLLQAGGSLLQVTSSSSPEAPSNPNSNIILYASKKIPFQRYEAHDAGRRWAVQDADRSAFDGRRMSIAAAPLGRLTFDVHTGVAGTYTLRLRWQDLVGIATRPVLRIDGRAIVGSRELDKHDGWQFTLFRQRMGVGDHVITVESLGGPMEVDYLDVERAFAANGPA